MRLHTDCDKATFMPGLTVEQLLSAIFVCSNFALCQEPFVRQCKRPQDRVEFFFRKLIESTKKF